MPLSAELKEQLRTLCAKDTNDCEEILAALPPNVHDELLEKRVKALADERDRAEARLKKVRAIAVNLTEDNLRMAYKEYSDEMRHFSTVRSALTTFLVTVSLAAFSAYFNKSQSHPFLIAAALIFAVAAVAVCFEFSRRTSKAYLRRGRIWKHFTNAKPVTELEQKDYPGPGQVVGKMLQDPTNYFLLIGLGLIVLAFYNRDSLSAFLPALHSNLNFPK